MAEKDDNTRKHISEFKWIAGVQNPEAASDRFPSRSDLAVQNQIPALVRSNGVVCVSRVAIRTYQGSASVRKFCVQAIIFETVQSYNYS